MFTIDWAFEFLDLIITTFSGMWDWMISPISETVLSNPVIGALIDSIVPDSIASLSPLVLMFGTGLVIYLGFQIIAWILSWLPIA